MATKGSRVSCWTCKRRKIGCDKTLPACNNCSRTSRRCEGFGIKLVWPDKTDGRRKPFKPTVVVNHDAGCNQTTSQTSSTYHFLNTSIDDIEINQCQVSSNPSYHHQSHCLNTVVISSSPLAYWNYDEASLFSYYEGRLSRMITTVDDAQNGFRNELLPMALTNRCEASQSLAEAVLALCAFHIGHEDDALRYRTKALRSLKHSLNQNDITATSIQIATCMILCVYGVFDPSDGNWMIHLRGAKSLAKKYPSNMNLSSFLRSWLLYHDALANFSQMESNNRQMLPIPEPAEDKRAIVGSLGCSEELMELIACIINLQPEDCDENYVKLIGMRLESLSQVIVIKHEDDHTSSPNSVDLPRIQTTAELYHLAALIYFRRHVQRITVKHPVVQSLVRSALDLISGMEVCTSPWPLFVVACEVIEDSERLQLLETFTKMEHHRRMGNITVTRMIVEAVWKQYDLTNDDLARAKLDWRTIVNLGELTPSFI